MPIKTCNFDLFFQHILSVDNELLVHHFGPNDGPIGGIATSTVLLQIYKAIQIDRLMGPMEMPKWKMPARSAFRSYFGTLISWHWAEMASKFDWHNLVGFSIDLADDLLYCFY
jgi:hypothetical protein